MLCHGNKPTPQTCKPRPDTFHQGEPEPGQMTALATPTETCDLSTPRVCPALQSAKKQQQKHTESHGVTEDDQQAVAMKASYYLQQCWVPSYDTFVAFNRMHLSNVGKCINFLGQIPKSKRVNILVSASQ